MRPSDEEYTALQKQLVQLPRAGREGRVEADPGREAAEARAVGLAGADRRAARAPRGRGDLGAGRRRRPRRATPAESGASAARPSAASSGAVFDDGLAIAIAQFQARHGINVDSSLGKETVDALNVPAEYRLGQIAANLERHRWLPRALGHALHLRERARVPARGVRQRRAGARDEGHRRAGVRGQGDAGVLRLDGDRRVPSVLERDARHPGEGDRAEDRVEPRLPGRERHGVLQRRRRSAASASARARRTHSAS